MVKQGNMEQNFSSWYLLLISIKVDVWNDVPAGGPPMSLTIIRSPQEFSPMLGVRTMK